MINTLYFEWVKVSTTAEHDLPWQVVCAEVAMWGAGQAGFAGRENNTQLV